MAFKIRIIEGHSPGLCFWFKPVNVNMSAKIHYEDITEYPDEFSISDDDVECFLIYFLYKYFDNELKVNLNRYDKADCCVRGFEWCLEHNFYTYDAIERMLDEIENVASLLETDFDNPCLFDVKKRLSVINLCPPGSKDYLAFEKSAVKKHINVATDFYRRFIRRLRSMLKNNPEAELISVMGP